MSTIVERFRRICRPPFLYLHAKHRSTNPIVRFPTKAKRPSLLQDLR